MLSKVESRKSKVKSKDVLFLLFAYCFLPIASNAQCAMCRAALESEGNSVKAEAVNDGIVYLMAIPYILVGIAGFLIYRMFSKKKS
jgi:phosphatidylglycerophosphatase A